MPILNFYACAGPKSSEFFLFNDTKHDATCLMHTRTKIIDVVVLSKYCAHKCTYFSRIREYENARIREYENTRIRECENAMREYENSRIREYKNAIIRECDARIREYENAMREYENTRWPLWNSITTCGRFFY